LTFVFVKADILLFFFRHTLLYSVVSFDNAVVGLYALSIFFYFLSERLSKLLQLLLFYNFFSLFLKSSNYSNNLPFFYYELSIFLSLDELIILRGSYSSFSWGRQVAEVVLWFLRVLVDNRGMMWVICFRFCVYFFSGK